MSFSNYLEANLLDCIGGKMWYTPPKLWVGLSLTTPAEDGSNVVEPGTVHGYQRVEILPTVWTYALLGGIANGVPITFPTASGNWGTITHFVIWDAYWMILYGELTPSRQINVGQKPRFNTFQLEIFLG